MIKERNICAELGCTPENGGPACCVYNWVEVTSLGELKSFGNIPHSDGDKPPYPGCTVYTRDMNPLSERNPRTIVKFKKCPRLTEEGDCGDQEGKPGACKYLVVGGKRCNEFRVRNGLPEITREQVAALEREG